MSVVRLYHITQVHDQHVLCATRQYYCHATCAMWHKFCNFSFPDYLTKQYFLSLRPYMHLLDFNLQFMDTGFSYIRNKKEWERFFPLL